MGNKIFIPDSIEKREVSTGGYFFSTKKMIYASLGCIMASMVVLYFFISGVPLWLFLLITMISLVGLVYFLRYVVFEERKFKRILRNLYKEKVSSINSFLWMNRVCEDNIIHMRTQGDKLVKKIIVKLIRTSPTGKGENFEEEFSGQIKKILDEILSRNYTVELHFMNDTKKVHPNTRRLLERIKGIELKRTRDLANKLVGNLSYLSAKYYDLEVIYLIVENSDFRKFESFKEDVELVVDSIDREYFKYVKILDKNEIEEYLKEDLCIRKLNQHEGGMEVTDIRKYGEILRIFDKDGNEEMVGDWVYDIVYSDIDLSDIEDEDLYYTKEESVLDKEIKRSIKTEGFLDMLKSERSRD